MANEKDHTLGNLGELSTIRNILMGQQMVEYNERFTDLHNKLQALEASLQQQLQAHETKVDKQFADTHQLLNNQETALLDAVAQSDKRLRNELGDLLIQLGQQLKQSQAR